MITLFRLSNFYQDTSGGGGHRCAQIAEVLAGFEFEDVMDHPNPPRWKNFFFGVLGMARYRLFPKSLSGVSILGFLDQQFRKSLQRSPEAERVLIWETTGATPAVRIAKYYGFKVMAFPHNVESLVDGQRGPLSGKHSPQWLDEEMMALRAADAVFAISWQDQWLMRNYGANASLLPYYPPKRVCERFLDIREQRKVSAVQEFILIMGSAANPPTMRGMREQLDWLRMVGAEVCIKVIGGGTATLRDEYHDLTQVEFLGRVDDETLTQLLAETKALWVHQSPTSGMLTRIVEALVAEVPVLANTDAAKELQYNPSVQAYERLPDSAEEFFDITGSSDGCGCFPEEESDRIRRIVGELIGCE